METVKGMFGSDVSMNHSCGFCRHHSCSLTAKQMKAKNCLGKQCDALERYTNHDFWRQHEQKKELRKARKQVLATFCG